MNYYDILETEVDATYEQLRESYLRLVKELHPDKQQHFCDSEKSTNLFIKVDEAWKTLGDVQKRKEYNASLLRKEVEEDVYIDKVLSLQEIGNESVNVVEYRCRCGSYFQIDQEEVKIEKEVIIGCDDCTNHILVCLKDTTA